MCWRSWAAGKQLQTDTEYSVRQTASVIDQGAYSPRDVFCQQHGQSSVPFSALAS